MLDVDRNRRAIVSDVHVLHTKSEVIIRLVGEQGGVPPFSIRGNSSLITGNE